MCVLVCVVGCVVDCVVLTRSLRPLRNTPSLGRRRPTNQIDTEKEKETQHTRLWTHAYITFSLYLVESAFHIVSTFLTNLYTMTIKKRKPTAASVVAINNKNKNKYVVTTRLLWTLLVVGGGAALLTHLTLTPDEVVLEHNILSGAIIFTVGDVGAQYLTSHSYASFVLDRQRLGISTALGAVWLGVANPAVYTAVERAFPGHDSWTRIFLKMILSCSVLSTVGNWTTMFIRRYLSHICHTVRDVYGVTRRQQQQQQGSDTTKDHPASTSRQLYATLWNVLHTKFRHTCASCNDDFWQVLVDDLMIWPAYDILCYAVIPPMARPITTAIMASCWSIYMSIASASNTTTTTTKQRHGSPLAGSTVGSSSTSTTSSRGSSMTEYDDDDEHEHANHLMVKMIPETSTEGLHEHPL